MNITDLIILAFVMSVFTTVGLLIANSNKNVMPGDRCFFLDRKVIVLDTGVDDYDYRIAKFRLLDNNTVTTERMNRLKDCVSPGDK